ncbi:MAG: Uma2 family endonuclease [Dehalococcoidia bacterium]|nr:Uma2 family endonuclease [Dehalococcoidia bacterium]
MATTRTIINAWENRYLPDIFYEQPNQGNDSVPQEARIIRLLRSLYANRSDVFISGMVSISYKVPDDIARFAPEFFIALDVPDATIRRDSPNFFIWKLGKSPDFVIEIASPSTAENDLGIKRDLYAELGIAEYWRFDPTGGELYGQPLAGERLVEGGYQPYALHTKEDGSVHGYSKLLDLDFCWDGNEFDVLDPETGRTIDPLEAEREARETERLEFEARERELLDELNRLRSQMND